MSYLICKQYKPKWNNFLKPFIYTKTRGGAHDVMIIVIGNRHGDPNSNPGPIYLHFT